MNLAQRSHGFSHKLFILFVSLTFCFHSFSQSDKITVKGTKQSWAGGMCCRSGINYSLTLTSAEIDLTELFIDSIFIDNKVYFCDLNVTKSKNYMQINFGYSVDERRNIVVEKPKKEGRDNLIILSGYKKKIELEIKEMNVVCPLAYP